MKNPLTKAVDAFNKIEEIALVVLFAVMVVIIFIQVIMRKSGNSLYWSEELGKFIFVWISWLGISIGQKQGEHIKITLLVDKFEYKKAQIFNIISDIAVIAICAVTFYYAVGLVFSQWGTRYAGIKISVGYGHLAVVTGTFFMMVRCLASIVDSYNGYRRGHALPGEDSSKEDGDMAEGGAL